MWSFVFRRKANRWIWLAQCRRTRQIVAYAVGDRSEQTCRLLWERVPKSYKKALLHTDFWDAYQKVLPDEQHEATGKGAGQTCPSNKASHRALQQHFAPEAGAASRADLVKEAQREPVANLREGSCVMRLHDACTAGRFQYCGQSPGNDFQCFVPGNLRKLTQFLSARRASRDKADALPGRVRHRCRPGCICRKESRDCRDARDRP